MARRVSLFAGAVLSGGGAHPGGSAPAAAVPSLSVQGYQGKRRVVSFGLHYDFNNAALHPADEMPPFMLDLRDSAAHFAGIPASALPHALVTEYTEGAGIGWHRDRAVFG